MFRIWTCVRYGCHFLCFSVRPSLFSCEGVGRSTWWLAIARAGRPEHAVATVDRGRAMVASEAMGLVWADVTRLAAAGHPELPRRFTDAVERVAALEAMLLGPTGPRAH